MFDEKAFLAKWDQLARLIAEFYRESWVDPIYYTLQTIKDNYHAFHDAKELLRDHDKWLDDQLAAHMPPERRIKSNTSPEFKEYTVDWDDITVCVVSFPLHYTDQEKYELISCLEQKPSFIGVPGDILITFRKKENKDVKI